MRWYQFIYIYIYIQFYESIPSCFFLLFIITNFILFVTTVQLYVQFRLHLHTNAQNSPDSASNQSAGEIRRVPLILVRGQVFRYFCCLNCLNTNNLSYRQAIYTKTILQKHSYQFRSHLLVNYSDHCGICFDFQDILQRRFTRSHFRHYKHVPNINFEFLGESASHPSARERRCIRLTVYHTHTDYASCTRDHSFIFNSSVHSLSNATGFATFTITVFSCSAHCI